MVWIPIAAAAVSAAGSYFGAKSQQDASQEMAREQMAFQERMSNTAHQREVDDLRRAGLNPILSTRHGGASTPSGAMGTATDQLGSSVRSGVSSAVQTARIEAELDNLEAQNRKLNAETTKTQVDTVKSAAETEYVKDQSVKTLYERVKLREESENLYEARGGITAESRGREADLARRLEDEEFYKTPLGQTLRKLGLGAGELGKLFGAGNSARSLTR